MMMTELKSLNLTELEKFVTDNGFPKFRAKQIFDWMNKGVGRFEDMTNLPKNLIEFLNANSALALVDVARKYVSEIDGTVKYLYALRDGNYIESVVMKYHHGYTICISSQVGCRMGCSFCQSTKGGKVRDLSAGEMLDQIIFANRDLGITIHNIVMMGIGEPLDNYDNVTRFLNLVNAAEGLNIGYRHISISTCGVVPGIYRLAELAIPITLSVSLHAPFDEMRSQMMPINRKYGIDELLKACKEYQQVTGRRISFEYTLVKGVNDSKVCASKLARLLRGLLCHVNLIPVNKIENGIYDPTDKQNIYAFQQNLVDFGINATVRRTLGADISASCGQLRSKQTKGEIL